jgi:hypothetical protein
MELQAVDTVNATVITPLLAGAAGAGHHQPMQDGEEDGPLEEKLKAAIGKKCLQDRAAAGVPPEPLERQRRTDTLPGKRWNAVLVDWVRLFSRISD